MEIFLVIVIGIIILIAKGFNKGKKNNESWEMAADAMDLSFHKSQGGWRTLSGIINGLQVSAKQASSTQGNSKANSIPVLSHAAQGAAFRNSDHAFQVFLHSPQPDGQPLQNGRTCLRFTVHPRES